MFCSRRFTTAVILAACTFTATATQAGPRSLANALESGRSATTVPPARIAATGTIELAFSPRGGGQELIVKVIDSAAQSVRLLAYSFTSAPITSALLRAKKRGVDVAIVVDHKSNVENGNAAKSRAALGALVAAGVAVRTTSAWQIHHDKVIIVDGRHVQTGSYNYSASAEERNSENVMALWENKQLAAEYLRHWTRNWNSGTDYVAAYAR